MHFLRHSTFAAHLLPFLSHAKEAGRAGQEAVGGARFSRREGSAEGPRGAGWAESKGRVARGAGGKTAE